MKPARMCLPIFAVLSLVLCSTCRIQSESQSKTASESQDKTASESQDKTASESQAKTASESQSETASESQSKTAAAFYLEGGLITLRRAWSNVDYAAYHKAVEFFQTAIQLQPNLKNAHLYLALTYHTMFVNSETPEQLSTFAANAIASYERVLSRDPNNITALSGIAAVYETTGNSLKARDYFLRSATVEPQNETALFAVSFHDLIYIENKGNSKARDQDQVLADEGLLNLDKALEINPSNDDAMFLKYLLLEEKSDLTSDSDKKLKLKAEADTWKAKALEARQRIGFPMETITPRKAGAPLTIDPFTAVPVSVAPPLSFRTPVTPIFSTMDLEMRVPSHSSPYPRVEPPPPAQPLAINTATGAILMMDDNARIIGDGAGGVYVSGGLQHRVYRIRANGTWSVVAGNGMPGFAGDGGPAASSQLDFPTGLALDSAGNLFIADGLNHRIRKVSSAGTISTIAGNGKPFVSGDRGPAIEAAVNSPYDLALDGSGNLFISQAENFRVRKVTPGGLIFTVAGKGAPGFSGDGGPATSARLNDPRGLAADLNGNLFIADAGNNVIRKVTPKGTITTIAGNGRTGFRAQEGPAASFQFAFPQGIAINAKGNVLITDANHRILEMRSNGSITTLAGNAIAGFSGDGGPAISAQLFMPTGIVVESNGNVLILDAKNHRIRRVTTAGLISTVKY